MLRRVPFVQGPAGGLRQFWILVHIFGREDEAEVTVLASAKVALDRCRIHHQDLMGLLDGGVVRLARVLGD